MLLQEILKRYLSFCCRIPINNNKDDNNGKASCGARKYNKKEPWEETLVRKEGGKSESNMNTHLSEN